MERLKSLFRFSKAGAIGFLLTICVVVAPARSQTPLQEVGICARVKIRISQDVTLTRTAFEATLEISNASGNVPIENLNVTVDITDGAGNPANALFGITGPVLTGVTDMSGTGTVAPGATASGVWTIVPTRDAAPDLPTRYRVGGTLSYVEGGTPVTIPLLPAAITVMPDPLLVLRYFLVRDVYSDDPFTPEVEPAEPYPLGLIVQNLGKGTARHFHITSAQPEIIENEKGLLIDFQIIGTTVNENAMTPSLAVDFGDIEPGGTGVARWIMTTSLQGKFIEYKATFEHLDDLGDVRTSLIDTVEIHEILKDVRIDLPTDDLRPDFLANDIDDADHLPDTLYSSDGSIHTVNIGINPLTSGTIDAVNKQAQLTVSAPGGWVYLSVPDPGMERYRLARVIRSDGREIRVDENAWTTHRTRRYVGIPVYREHTLHLLDFDSTGNYTLIYETGDFDRDGVADDVDNCPDDYNPDQINTDRASETTAGYPPGDLMGDACDTDDDNDGFTDADEGIAGSDPTEPFSVPDTTVVQLRTGLNLVSIPADTLFLPTMGDWQPALEGGGAVLEEVDGYVPPTQRFVRATPGQAAGWSHPVEGGDGMQVYALGPGTVIFSSRHCPAKNLVAGTNFLGFPCAPADYSAFDLLAGLGATNIRSVQRFSRATGQFETAAFDGTQPTGVNFPLVKGEGYYLYMNMPVAGFRVP